MKKHTHPFPTDTRSSPHAQLKPVPLNAVRLEDVFWQPMFARLRQVTLPTQYEQMEKTGRIDNFRRAAGRQPGPFQGYFFNDSDVYKWVEAAAWALAGQPDAALQAMLDELIELFEAAQQPDGYLNTYFTLQQPEARWTNLSLMHELYCAGHLIQAAVAHQRASGGTRLMAVAQRFADHICATFGAEAGKKPGASGHPEIEMALVELYRQSGDARYLQQAQYFIDARGKGYAGGQSYLQDHKPFRELERMVGHAVRMLYLCAGAADLVAETGEQALLNTLERLWEGMARGQVYISGGLGAHHQGEAFGCDYQLPSERAYAETCAGIASLMWNWRMLSLGGDVRFADLLETTLYNAVLPGIGLDGRSYFYQNPLADDGSYRRRDYYDCACCPPNIARLFASLPAYFYSQSADTIWVHLYAQGRAHLHLPDGRHISLQQRTRYPWDGEIAIEVDGEGEFALNLRIPGYCDAPVQVLINGHPSDAATPGQYLVLRRTWQPDDRVQLKLPFAPRWVESHPYAAENTDKLALLRGPLLYCLEGVDHAGIDLRDLRVSSKEKLHPLHQMDLLGGVMELHGKALHCPPDPDWQGRLYRRAGKVETVRCAEVEIRAVPYYAWANRQPGQMLVWLRKQVN